MVAILVLLTIIVFLTVDYFVERARVRSAAAVPAAVPRPRSVRAPADVTALPAGVFAGPGHAWLELRPAGDVRLGADRVPLTLLGGVDAVELAPEGSVLHRGDPVAVLRKGDRTIKLRSPVDGEVTATNPAVEEHPDALDEHPFGAGWLVRLAPSRLGESLKRMFVAEGAAEWMRRELSRLRDLLVGFGDRPALAAATLPDGGLPVDGLAAALSDDEWRTLTEALFDPAADSLSADAGEPAA